MQLRFGRKVKAGIVARSLGHLQSQVWGLGEFLEGFDEAIFVGGFDENSGLVWQKGFGDAANVIGDDWEAGHLGFDEEVWKGFFCRGVDGYVAFLVESVWIAEQSGEIDAIC